MSRDIRTHFGQKVREVRLKKGYTQESLADKAKLHSTYIGQVERGVRNPSLVNIHKIKRALAVSIKEIFPE